MPPSVTPNFSSPRISNISCLDKERINSALAPGRKGLVYQSAAFADDTEITGQLKLKLWLALNVPDTDLTAMLYEIKADDTALYLTQTTIRARYRESLRQAKLAQPGAINLYSFDTFYYFSRSIAKGSRLRLLLTGANPQGTARNFNGGGNPNAESGRDARTATISVYHDAKHPSVLELPVVKKPLGTAAR